MRLSQQIEIIAEVKKEAEVKHGARDRVEIGVSVYLGKDKKTGKTNSQWYTCMTFDQSYGDLFLNRCPKGSVIKVIGDVQYRIGLDKKSGEQTVYGTVFVKHAEYIGVSEYKAKSGYSKPQQQGFSNFDQAYVQDSDIPALYKLNKDGTIGVLL